MVGGTDRPVDQIARDTSMYQENDERMKQIHQMSPVELGDDYQELNYYTVSHGSFSNKYICQKGQSIPREIRIVDSLKPGQFLTVNYKKKIGVLAGEPSIVTFDAPSGRVGSPAKYGDHSVISSARYEKMMQIDIIGHDDGGGGYIHEIRLYRIRDDGTTEQRGVYTAIGGGTMNVQI